MKLERKLLKEFNKAHFSWSLSKSGHMRGKPPENMKLVSGTWYWKGYNMAQLSSSLRKNGGKKKAK